MVSPTGFHFGKQVARDSRDSDKAGVMMDLPASSCSLGTMPSIRLSSRSTSALVAVRMEDGTAPTISSSSLAASSRARTNCASSVCKRRSAAAAAAELSLYPLSAAATACSSVQSDGLNLGLSVGTVSSQSYTVKPSPQYSNRADRVALKLVLGLGTDRAWGMDIESEWDKESLKQQVLYMAWANENSWRLGSWLQTVKGTSLRNYVTLTLCRREPLEIQKRASGIFREHMHRVPNQSRPARGLLPVSESHPVQPRGCAPAPG